MYYIYTMLYYSSVKKQNQRKPTTKMKSWNSQVNGWNKQTNKQILLNEVTHTQTWFVLTHKKILAIKLNLNVSQLALVCLVCQSAFFHSELPEKVNLGGPRLYGSDAFKTSLKSFVKQNIRVAGFMAIMNYMGLNITLNK